MKPLHLLSAIALSLLVSTPALAEPGLWSIALTGRIFQEPDGSVTVYDLTPGSRVRVGVDAAPSRTLTTNPCGLLVISPSKNYPLSTVQVEGTVINPSSLARQIQPSCRSNGTGHILDEPRTTSFINTSTGNLVIVTGQPNRRLTVTYPGLYRTFSRQVNACGFLRIRETSRINFNDFLLLPVAGLRSLAEFRLSDLTTLNGLLCNRGNLYRPADWAGFPEVAAIPGSEITEEALGEKVAIASPSGQAIGGVVSSPGGGGSPGDTGGGGTGDTGSAPDPGSGSDTGSPGSGLSDFTPTTYNPSLHDWNGDGLVDDANGDGIADDRDSDGHPDGPWGPNDLANSAGPGLTPPTSSGVGPTMDVGLPGIQSVCYGFDGSLVAVDSRLVRGQPYTLDGDDWSSTAKDTAISGGSMNGHPVLRFQHPSGDSYNHPQYTQAYGEAANGYILDSRDDPKFMFNLATVKSCLVPPWMA